MKPNDILTLAAHFRGLQNDDISMGAYNAALSFLKDYVAEFCRRDCELAQLFGTEDFVAKIEYVPQETELLAEGPIDDSILGFVYKTKKRNKKDFFRVLDKHLVPTTTLK